MLSRRRALFQGNQSRPPRPWDYPAVLEYWDARSGVTSSGERVSAWAGRKGFAALEQATGANQPILLPYSGTNYLWLPGVAGNYASAPDSAPLSITGDITIVVRVAMDDWTPSTNQAFACKRETGKEAFQFLQQTTGAPTFSWWTGGTPTTKNSSAAVSFTDRAFGYLAVTLDVDNGAAGSDCKFWTSSDGASFTQLGTTQTTAGTTSIDDTTAIFEMGSYFAGTQNLLAGKMGRVQVYSGIPAAFGGGGGTLVFDANFSAVSEGATSFTESSSNAATVTINSTGSKPAQIVGSQQLLFDGSAYYMATGALTLNQPETVLFCGKQVTWTTSDTIYDGNSVNTMRLYQTGTTPQVNLYAGASAAPNTDWAVGANAILSAVYNGASSSLGVNLNTRTTGNASTGNGGGLYLGASAGPTGYGNIQCKALAVCNSALSTEQLTALIASINRYHSVF